MAEFSGLSSRSSSEGDSNDPQAIQQQQTQQADSQPSAPTSGNIISSPQSPLSSSSSAAARKPCGRPLGAKIKPGAPIYMTLPAIEYMQLLVPRGSDIPDFVQNYARKNRVGVRILNGTGNVSHFNLISRPEGTITDECTLFTMSGTYVDTSLYSNSIEGGISSVLPGGQHPWLTVLVQNNFGMLYGGIVVSRVLAATNVVLHVQTSRIGGFYRLDIGLPDGGSHSGAPGGGGNDVGGGFDGGNGSGLGSGGLTIPAS